MDSQSKVVTFRQGPAENYVQVTKVGSEVEVEFQPTFAFTVRDAGELEEVMKDIEKRVVDAAFYLQAFGGESLKSKGGSVKECLGVIKKAHEEESRTKRMMRIRAMSHNKGVAPSAGDVMKTNEPKTNICPDCEGKGKILGGKICNRCKGAGEVFEKSKE